MHAGSFITRTRYVAIVSMIMLLTVLVEMITIASMEASPFPYHYGQQSKCELVTLDNSLFAAHPSSCSRCCFL